MPLPPPTRVADERRIAAQRSRLQRTLRVARLRRQVLAAAVGTFALAFGLVAFDGSMGRPTASRSASSGAGAALGGSSQPATDALGAPVPDDSLSTDDDGSSRSFDDEGAGAAGPAAPATTSQS